MAQERNFSIVLPELQYSKRCSSEISLRNTSPRFIDVDIAGHKSTGALVALTDRPSNHFRLRPAERLQLRLDVENDTAWAEVIETVPHASLTPGLAVAAKTECLDGNKLLTAAREDAPVSSNPGFAIDHSAAKLNGMVLLVVNASSQPMHWTACYSAGHTVSDGTGRMTPLCSETVHRTLAPFQSSRVAATVDGNPLVRFHSEGLAVAMQMLASEAPQVRLYRVESTILFDDR